MQVRCGWRAPTGACGRRGYLYCRETTSDRLRDDEYGDDQVCSSSTVSQKKRSGLFRLRAEEESGWMINLDCRGRGPGSDRVCRTKQKKKKKKKRGGWAVALQCSIIEDLGGQ
ncbi:Uncharacterized protein HZ326_17214, partial [Fusarium oxysporum f. sp. albedinis]